MDNGLVCVVGHLEGEKDQGERWRGEHVQQVRVINDGDERDEKMGRTPSRADEQGK